MRHAPLVVAIGLVCLLTGCLIGSGLAVLHNAVHPHAVVRGVP